MQKFHSKTCQCSTNDICRETNENNRLAKRRRRRRRVSVKEDQQTQRMKFRYVFRSPRWSLLVRCLLFLTIVYLLNVLFGVESYLWWEKSFERDFPSSILHIDLNQLDEDQPETRLGPAKYLLPNEFLISNSRLCHRGETTNESRLPRLLILVKSAIGNRQARQAIRQTWANKDELEKNSVRLGFVLGRRIEKREIRTNRSFRNVGRERKCR